MSDGGYDRLAVWYPMLETAMFGRRLSQTRRDSAAFFVEHLQTPRSICLLGDGRGQMTRWLSECWRHAEGVCIDRSDRMLQRQRRRVSPRSSNHWRFVHTDILRLAAEDDTTLGAFAADVIVMPMFADCFTAEALSHVLRWCDRTLTSSGVIAWLDFCGGRSPGHRWKIWAMHRWFGWVTDLPNRELVDMHDVFTRSGFVVRASRTHQDGLLQSRIYRRSNHDTTSGTSRSA